jgi:hypothetical protein
MRFTRTRGTLALFLGLLGLVACAAAIVAVWIGSARLNRVADNLFGKMDKCLLAVRERVSGVAERVQESKITAQGMERSLRDWAAKEAAQRLASRADVQEKAARLAGVLRQADDWLELSTSSTQIVREVLSMASAAGVPTSTALADRLLDEIGALRNHLARATQLVERIGDVAVEAREEKTPDKRMRRAAEAALQLLATLGSIDERLEKLDGRVSEIQEQVFHWKATTHRWILIAAIFISLLFVWMAAGQSFLCHHGWKVLSLR